MTRPETLAGATLAFGAAWLASWPRRRPAERPPLAWTASLLRPVPRSAAAVAVLGVWWSTARGPHSMLLAGTFVIGTLGVQRLLTAGERRNQRRRRQRAVIELCDGLAAELRAGLAVSTAIERACAGRPDWQPILRSSAVGADVAAAMDRQSVLPGAEGLRAVASAWRVAWRSGAALAVVLDRIAVGLRCDADARAEVQALLGPPRATARLLAVLPVIGLALGSSMGARPLAFLLGTSLGAGLLLCGVGLALVGLLWVERLADAADP